VLGELADNHAGGDDVHQDQDGGLWVGCARHRRDVAESGIKVTTKVIVAMTLKMLAGCLVKRTSPAYRRTATMAGTTVKMTAPPVC
jgi:hypothetical protein